MTITEEEQRSRRESWAFAIASIKLERLPFPGQAMALVEQHINGDLEHEALCAALHEMCGIELR